MFVFDANYTFEWPVKVHFPGGEVKEFTGIFRAPDDEKEIFEKVTGEDTPAMLDAARALLLSGGPTAVTLSAVAADIGVTHAMLDAARARLARYLVGWRGIEVQGGGELPYSDAARDNLLRQRPIRMAVDMAMFEALVGVREKN